LNYAIVIFIAVICLSIEKSTAMPRAPFWTAQTRDLKKPSLIYAELQKIAC